MIQKVITIFTGTDNRIIDHQKEIEIYLKEGWEIRQISTAYIERAGVGMSVAIALLLGK
ncbi:MAG: hypothetical protein LBS55_12520 [Prevotellaceae bacterium]|jgi:hypothetical protein|nr:hypothetical protein [Prevotellaceae bacterium]